MNRGRYERIIRIAHRWLAMGAGGFFFLSLFTGLLWADARFLYWDDHYKEKVVTVPGPSVESARLSISEVFDVVNIGNSEPMTAEHLALRSDFGRLLYEVKLRRDDTPVTVLLDAVTGERLSPAICRVGDDNCSPIRETTGATTTSRCRKLSASEEETKL